MFNDDLKRLIENKLSMIDLLNEQSYGESDVRKFHNELIGIKLALRTFGISFHFYLNPYYYMDKEPSSYKLEQL